LPPFSKVGLILSTKFLNPFIFLLLAHFFQHKGDTVSDDLLDVDL